MLITNSSTLQRLAIRPLVGLTRISRISPACQHILSPPHAQPSFNSPSLIQNTHSRSYHPSPIMASSDILSQTLSSITSIKLEEIINQRSTFEDGKAKLLKAVKLEPNQHEKIRILLDGIEDLASMGKLEGHPVLSLKNIRLFLEQAACDPSVSDSLQKDWHTKLEAELNIHSLKHEYASLYGRLVNEWLNTASGDSASSNGSTFENAGRKEMHDQRAKWEDYVFKACEIDTTALESALRSLFKSSTPIETAYTTLRKATANFELEMKNSTHFDDFTLKWVIQGLLRSDLVTDEKRKVLEDFLNNKVVLAEIADILNMRMNSLEKWKWDPQGTLVEIRRQLNGRYRFYHDEDLLQSILLRYIGVRWSVFFKGALTSFYNSMDVWKPSSTPIPISDRKRREYFLGQTNGTSSYNVESARAAHFYKEILLEQLSATVGEKRGGYNDDDHYVEMSTTRKSGQQITQTLLHTLATEIIMKTRLGQQLTVVCTDFAWFGPSLPHATMFTVLKLFNVSDRWINFFRTVLEAPMKFQDDGVDAPVRIRKRGTPISGPLSDMLGETTLFCLDFAFNQQTNGARMYRLHDDIWFWGNEETCVEGWKVMTRFAQLTGLAFNEEKTGSVKIARQAGVDLTVSPSLPKGDVVWGFLKLDAASGRFLIDQKKVDIHIEELRRQLDACKSTFDWIQAWNVYGARFFTTNFGKPANCYGQEHVTMILETFARIQKQLFSKTGGSVTSTLKQMLSARFGVQNIPEGYLYFPTSMGGLDLKNPFVNFYLIKDTVPKNPDPDYVIPTPDSFMDAFFKNEKEEYRKLKKMFDDEKVSRKSFDYVRFDQDLIGSPFMSFEEFTKFREITSAELTYAYHKLLEEPREKTVVLTSEVEKAIEAMGGSGKRGRDGRSLTWSKMSSYQKWIVGLYAADMIRIFGGLNVVDRGLLPVGMVGMFRESRFKWQG